MRAFDTRYTRQRSASQATYAGARVRGSMWLRAHGRHPNTRAGALRLPTAASSSVRARAQADEQQASRSQSERAASRHRGWAVAGRLGFARASECIALEMQLHPDGHLTTQAVPVVRPPAQHRRCGLAGSVSSRPLRRLSGCRCGPAGRNHTHDDRTAVLRQQRVCCPSEAGISASAACTQRPRMLGLMVTVWRVMGG